MNSPVPVKTLMQAQQLLAGGKYAEAEALLASIPEASPLYSQSCHLNAIIALNKGRPRDALAQLHKAIRLGDHSPMLTPNYASIIVRADAFNTDSLATLLDLTQKRAPRNLLLGLLAKTLQIIGYAKDQPYEKVRLIFEKYVHPLMLWALETGQHDIGLFLETQTYECLVKQKETETHFRELFATWTEAMLAAGRRKGATLPARGLTPGKTRRRVAFFVHVASTLAHIDALINMLRGYRQLEAQPFDPVVYCFQSRHPQMEAAFAELGVPLVLMDVVAPETAGSTTARLLRIREKMAEEDVDAVVWISLGAMLAYTFALRLAPVQIWWAMKYHGLDFAEIDERVTSLSFSSQTLVNGVPWRAGRLQTEERFDPAKTAEAESLVAGYRPATILGTLAREEKMLDPAFLDTVSGILEAHPETVFLWTGRNEHPVIRNHFRARGLDARTPFIGWVETRLYAQVLDIFLDSFPFGCGFTALDAMAASRPVVFMASSQEGNPSLDQLIHPVLEGRNVGAEDHEMARAIFCPADGEALYLRAGTTDEYRALVARLIADPAWRQRVGAAYRGFVSRMMSDTTKTARDYSSHFLQAIAAKEADHGH
jgi:hypothetical protein